MFVTSQLAKSRLYDTRIRQLSDNYLFRCRVYHIVFFQRPALIYFRLHTWKIPTERTRNSGRDQMMTLVMSACTFYWL